MFDIEPRFPGAEGWATNNDNIIAADGTIVGPRGKAHMNFGVWWQGGPVRQMLDNSTIARWNYGNDGGHPLAWPMAMQGARSTRRPE